MKPELAWLGKILAVLFSVCVILSSITGGNMFQAWNIADVTNEYFGVTGWISGIVLTTLVAMVIIGGIKRIGLVAGTLVPVMVFFYLIAGFYVLFVHFEKIPGLLALMV